MLLKLSMTESSDRTCSNVLNESMSFFIPFSVNASWERQYEMYSHCLVSAAIEQSTQKGKNHL